MGDPGELRKNLNMVSNSLVAQFDDYVRKTRALIDQDLSKEFLIFVRNQEQCRIKWKAADDECLRLRGELDKALSEISAYERKLKKARVTMHEEQSRADQAETERDELQEQLRQIQEILGNICRAGDQLANETKEKLDKFLNATHTKIRISGEGLYPKLSTIEEINSTGDLLSDMSYTRSEDDIDLELSDRGSRCKKPRRSDGNPDDKPSKRRRSARLSAYGVKKTSRDHLVATTTVSMPSGGPVTASARIETVPSGPVITFPVPSAPPQPTTSSSSDSEALPPRRQPLNRPHDFTARTVLRPNEECSACLKSMVFASKMVRCGECKACAHVECRDAVPLPCMHVLATPRGERNPRLAEMCGPAPPFVPPILVRCVLEVERRGLNEIGLYRVPGSEKDVRGLKSRFLRGKATSSLANFEIPVICGVLKDFLRSLPEPVVTYALWSSFMQAVREVGDDRAVALYQVVSELPAPNRDTLSFILLHLIKVTQSPQCKMTASNLATVFGPTLVGYSSANPSNSDISLQTPMQAMVVDSLLELGEDYWRSLLQKEQTIDQLTPKYSFRKRNAGKSFKIFNTPPTK